MSFLFARISVFVNLLDGLSSTPFPKKKNDGDLKFGAPPDHIHKLFFSKSAEGEQPVGGILIFTRIYVFPSVCLTPHDQTKKDADLILGTHTRQDHI